MRIHLVTPGNIRHLSGGNVYNARLAEHLAVLGAHVKVTALDGGWPVGSAADRGRLAATLDGAGTDVVILDGLIAGGAPREIETAAQAGLRIWVLVHMTLADNAALERRALAAAAGVICTSSTAAADIRERYGLGAQVVIPGTDAVAGLPRPRLNDTPRLVMVAALLPNKDQALLVEVLAKLRRLPWTAALVGSTTADPAYADRVREAITDQGLQDRVRLTGELSGDALEEQWRAADLSLLISRSESFGMVVVESISHGVPVLVRAGTGAVEALGPHGAGVAVDLSAGPGPLEAALREWLQDPGLRRQWRDAALAARGSLPRWEDAAAKVLAIVGGSGSAGASGTAAGLIHPSPDHGAE